MADIKEKCKEAALAALDKINSGSSVAEANRVFESISGHRLNHSGKRDFVRLLCFYGDVK